MSSVNYIHDGSGKTFIPATQRPDGSWRRPIRVRDGYVPQEEQPLYVSKGKEKGPYPAGLSAAELEAASERGAKGASVYFEIGNYEPATKIPGLNFVKATEDEQKGGSKKKKKNKKGSEGGQSTPTPTPTNAPLEPPPNNESQPSSAAPHTDPLKRLRNLRKKLKDIEALEVKVRSGDLVNPEKDQLEKIHRKEEVVEEIHALNAAIASLSLRL